MMALDRISEDDAGANAALAAAAAAAPSLPSRFPNAAPGKKKPSSSTTSAARKGPAGKRSSSSGGASGGGGPTTVTPDLYRSALNRRWSSVISRATTHPEEARYVNPADGLTALHLAVMSRVVPTTQSFRGKASGGGGSSVAGSAAGGGVGVGGSASESGRLRNSHGAEIPGLTGRIKSPAPMDAVRSLLVAWPDGAMVRDRRRGYTPLAYACLVAPPPKEDEGGGGGGDDATVFSAYSAYSTKSRATVYASLLRDSYGILEEAEKLVRLLLRHRPECAAEFTHDGLSPLDVHIVSYSVGWGAEETEGGAAGRTSSGVLRTLLESEPSLALSRPRRRGGAETVGPLELLYKYNAAGFLETLAQEDEKAKMARNGGSSVSAAAIAQRRKKEEAAAAAAAADGSVVSMGDRGRGLNSARNTLSSWWVWKWSILLLKYLHHRRGRKFQAVHAAASVPGCPLPLLVLAVRAFPNQIREDDEYQGDGNLPLHMVAGWGLAPPPLHHDEKAENEEDEYDDPRAIAAAAAAADPITSSRRGMVLSELLTEYPSAARVRNADGKTPLALALEAGVAWSTGARRLVRAYPPALMVRDEITFLMPFMTAAAAASASKDRFGGGDDRRAVATVYELLRAEPMALLRFVPGWTEEDMERGWGGLKGRRRRAGGGARR